MELNQFLVKAKINTYAKAGEGSERKLEDGGRELVYELEYHGGVVKKDKESNKNYGL